MMDFEALIDGYRRFRLGAYREQRERYDQLAQAQAPAVMVIACSDSRVDPTRVFDSGPGELFVLRNIANLVPPVSAISGQSSVAAAVEYAVTGLKVRHIVVFGHAGNGNLHVNIMYRPDDASETARAQAALPRLFALVLSLGGTLSGEHGIGVAKRDWMERAFDAPTLAAMRAIKAALDPDGILNPGKVLPPL